jgi:hypothetical protein
VTRAIDVWGSYVWAVVAWAASVFTTDLFVLSMHPLDDAPWFAPPILALTTALIVRCMFGFAERARWADEELRREERSR